MKRIFVLLLLISLSIKGFSQLTNPDADVDWLTGKVEDGSRIISTGVPLLLIAPDSRAGALGDLGAASTPDANAIHWNASKLSFMEKNAGLTFTYSPWLREIVSDIKLMYLSGYFRIDDRSTIEGVSTGTYKPNEFAIDLAYSMKLSENLALALTGRYIRSDLTQGQNVGTTATHAANAAAADLGLYYQNTFGDELPSEYAFGLQISNLGTKISYSDNMESAFLPANLRLGGRYTMNFDQFNSLSIMADVNKLLVPTPPVLDENGDIYAGMDPNVGIVQGAIQSFYDAPNGLKEELQEFTLSVGAEYWYNKILAVRAGYFYEAPNKGARQYLTLGAGLRYNVMGLDISYLISTAALNNNPLKNTLRVSLSFDL